MDLPGSWGCGLSPSPDELAHQLRCTHGIRERLWKAGLLTRTRANVRAGVPAMSSLSLPICPRGVASRLRHLGRTIGNRAVIRFRRPVHGALGLVVVR
jgi:hypothetical protein